MQTSGLLCTSKEPLVDNLQGVGSFLFFLLMQDKKEMGILYQNDNLKSIYNCQQHYILKIGLKTYIQ